MPDSGGQHPIDRGWAWVVLAGAMVGVFIITGTFKCFGVLYVEFIIYFNTSATMASIIQGLNTLITSLASIFVLLIGLKLFTCRTCVITGGVFYVLGYGLSSFAGSIEFLFFSYSLLIGVGMGLSFPPIVIILGSYFERKRGVAHGLMMASGSLGGLVIAPLLRVLLDEYLVHGTLLIVSAISANIIVSGTLVRPTSFYSKKKCKDNDIKIKLLESNGSKLKDNYFPRIACDERLFLSAPDLRQPALGTNNVSNVDRVRTVSDAQSRDPEVTRSEQLIQKFRSNEFMLDLSIADIQLRSNSVDLYDNSKLDHEASSEVFFNVKIFKNPSYLLLLFAYSIGAIGTALPISYIPAFAIEKGLSTTDAAFLITIIGTADVIGRVFAGFISDKGVLRRTSMIALSMTINGVFQMFISFYSDYWTIIMFCIVYGLFGNVIAAVYAATLLEIIDLKDYRNALCVMYTGYGICTAVSAPFIGELRDSTNTYVTCFYVFGTSHVVSAALLWSERFISGKNNLPDNEAIS